MLLYKVPHRIMSTYIFNSCSQHGNRALNPYSVCAVLCPQIAHGPIRPFKNILKASIFICKQSFFWIKNVPVCKHHLGLAIDKFMHIHFFFCFLPNKFHKKWRQNGENKKDKSEQTEQFSNLKLPTRHYQNRFL